MPRGLDYLWSMFCRMRRRKGSNGYSQQPLEWPDIEAFLRLTRQTLVPWELEVVEELDDLFLKMSQAKASPTDG